MRKKNLILVGGGGHCNACLDVITLLGFYNIVGIVEKNDTKLEKINNYPVFKDNEITELSKSCKNFLLTIGKIGDSKVRENIFHTLEALGISIASLISPTAYVAKNVHFGLGVHIMHHAIINTNASIGENTIINSQSLIEHDSNIGSHSHISTGVKINGEVNIGNNTFIGSGTIIHEGVNIGNDVVITAGSVINRDISDETKYQ